MRQKRTEKFSNGYGMDIDRILQENTYGGSKDGRIKIRRQLPVIIREEGIKIEWDRYPEEYPPIVRLKMTDGEWVTYQIQADQPGFQKDPEKRP